MAMTQNSITIGVFSTMEQAKQAIQELQRAGFSDEELGFLTRADTVTPSSNEVGAQAATVALEGSVLGGVLGAVAALLIPGFGPAIAGGVLVATLGGAALGATAGGVIGVLTGMGFSQEDAHFYQRELEKGRAILTVKAFDGHEAASNGAQDARTQLSIINPSPTQRPHLTDEGGPDSDNHPSLS